MKSELIVDVRDEKIQIALTEDDRLQEINSEERGTDNFAVGNIYYGRVHKVMPALNACFVDVGHEKEAFLHFLDLGPEFLTTQAYVTKALSDRRKMPSMAKLQRQPVTTKEGQIGDAVKIGDMLLVQVSKEPINTKGPRLTTEISIAGRNMVLIPFTDKVMVSSKIRRESEKSRLRQLVQSIKPAGYGVIVRTVAEDKRASELDAELKALVKRWEDVVKTLQKPVKLETAKKQPGQKDPEIRLVGAEAGRTIGIIRDLYSPSFSAVHINDETMCEEVKRYVELIDPQATKIVKLYTGNEPIFDHFDITRQMTTGLGRTVGFKNGGYLVIDKTEALFAIDVNSGSKRIYEDQEENAFQYNMLAADEIVHQLRLRDIGGIIIVDFIDMDTKEHNDQLYEHMRQLMNNDRAKHNVLPLSKFGLMQITRQRVRPAVQIEVSEVCPTCGGKGKIQSSMLFMDTLKEQVERFHAEHGNGGTLYLNPIVAAYVSKGFLGSLRGQWRRQYGLTIIEDQSLGILQTRFSEKAK